MEKAGRVYNVHLSIHVCPYGIIFAEDIRTYKPCPQLPFVKEEFLAQGEEPQFDVYADTVLRGCSIVGESTDILRETASDIKVALALLDPGNNLGVKMMFG